MKSIFKFLLPLFLSLSFPVQANFTNIDNRLNSKNFRVILQKELYYIRYALLALDHYKNGDLHQFFAAVGDNLCEVYAVNLLTNPRNSKQIDDYIEQMNQAKSAIQSILKKSEKLDHYNSMWKEIYQQGNPDNWIKQITYLHILHKPSILTHDIHAEVSHENPSPLKSTQELKNGATQDELSLGFASIQKNAQQSLNAMANEFLQLQAIDIKGGKLQRPPFYSTMIETFAKARAAQIPVVVVRENSKLKQLEYALFISQDGFFYTYVEHQSPSWDYYHNKNVLVVQGIGNEDFDLKELDLDKAISLVAADHEQIPGDSHPHAYKPEANKRGHAKEDPKFFSINSVYADQLANVIQREREFAQKNEYRLTDTEFHQDLLLGDRKQLLDAFKKHQDGTRQQSDEFLRRMREKAKEVVHPLYANSLKYLMDEVTVERAEKKMDRGTLKTREREKSELANFFKELNMPTVAALEKDLPRINYQEITTFLFNRMQAPFPQVAFQESEQRCPIYHSLFGPMPDRFPSMVYDLESINGEEKVVRIFLYYSLDEKIELNPSLFPPHFLNRFTWHSDYAEMFKRSCEFRVVGKKTKDFYLIENDQVKPSEDNINLDYIPALIKYGNELYFATYCPREVHPLKSSPKDLLNLPFMAQNNKNISSQALDAKKVELIYKLSNVPLRNQWAVGERSIFLNHDDQGPLYVSEHNEEGFAEILYQIDKPHPQNEITLAGRKIQLRDGEVITLNEQECRELSLVSGQPFHSSMLISLENKALNPHEKVDLNLLKCRNPFWKNKKGKIVLSHHPSYSLKMNRDLDYATIDTMYASSLEDFLHFFKEAIFLPGTEYFMRVWVKKEIKKEKSNRPLSQEIYKISNNLKPVDFVINLMKKMGLGELEELFRGISTDPIYEHPMFDPDEPLDLLRELSSTLRENYERTAEESDDALLMGQFLACSHVNNLGDTLHRLSLFNLQLEKFKREKGLEEYRSKVMQYVLENRIRHRLEKSVDNLTYHFNEKNVHLLTTPPKSRQELPALVQKDGKYFLYTNYNNADEKQEPRELNYLPQRYLKRMESFFKRSKKLIFHLKSEFNDFIKEERMESENISNALKKNNFTDEHTMKIILSCRKLADHIMFDGLRETDSFKNADRQLKMLEDYAQKQIRNL